MDRESPVESRSISTVELAPATVLLDELNQSFQTKEPLRIGAGGGSESRFLGAIGEASVFDTDLVPEAIQILATPESIAKIAAIPCRQRTDGQARKIRQCFLATEAPGIDQAADRRARCRAGGARRR